MVHPTDFRALSEEHPWTSHEYRGLVQSTRACIQFHTKGWDCPAVEYVSCSDDQANMGIDGQSNAVVDFKQTELSFHEFIVWEHVGIEGNRASIFFHIVRVLV